jgi:uncharacterized RDD family membrane protein YckC
MDKVDPNKRVCALVIDFLIISSINTSLSFLLHINRAKPFFSLLSFLFYVFRDSYHGQSPGKMLVGLQATDQSDKPTDYAASFKRNIILFWPIVFYIFIPAPKPEIHALNQADLPTLVRLGLNAINAAISIIEYITATRRKDGRRMGDMLAGTKVIDLKPETPGWIFAVIAVVLIAIHIFIDMLLTTKP